MASIKLTNDVKISSESLELKGIDTSNVLAELAASVRTYTAVQDCWVLTEERCYSGFNYNESLLDGKIVHVWRGIGTNNLNSAYMGYMIPVKKGQTITFGFESPANHFVYGLK